MPIKPYSLKELAAMYHVAKNTFKKWIEPFQNELGKRSGYYYSNIQVKIIFEKLGTPKSNEKQLVSRKLGSNSLEK